MNSDNREAEGATVPEQRMRQKHILAKTAIHDICSTCFDMPNLQPNQSATNQPIKTVKNTSGTNTKDDFLRPNPSFIEQRANKGAMPIKSKEAVATAGICTNMPAISKVKIPTMRTKQGTSRKYKKHNTTCDNP
mgnify:CR=1 FL=1